MKQWGVAPDRITVNAEIDGAIKRGRLEEAVDIFEKTLNGVSLSHLGFDFATAVCLGILFFTSITRTHFG